jgi:hypothetical protein
MHSALRNGRCRWLLAKANGFFLWHQQICLVLSRLLLLWGRSVFDLPDAHHWHVLLYISVEFFLGTPLVGAFHTRFYNHAHRARFKKLFLY